MSSGGREIAEWAGAGATTLTAIVAVCIALWGSWADQRRVEREFIDRRNAVLASLGHAHALLHVMFKGNDTHPGATFPRGVVLSNLESAIEAVRHALRLPFVDDVLLRHSLNLKSYLTFMKNDVASLPHGSYLVVSAMTGAFQEFRVDIDRAREMLRGLGADVGED
ncbi:MAG: hypothetical protein ABI306_09730 [Caulobacteraceae bacterium]